MAKFNEKISTILNSQLPEFVVADHPKFTEFLKVYYQLLESAELSFSSVQETDGILLQSETGQINNLVLNSSRKDTARTLLDEGDKILLEETPVGSFTRGETIVGQTSGATAFVICDRCETVQEICDDSVSGFLASITKKTKMKASKSNIELHGLCNDCTDKSTSSN